jgi:hypothetical protein
LGDPEGRRAMRSRGIERDAPPPLRSFVCSRQRCSRRGLRIHILMRAYGSHVACDEGCLRGERLGALQVALRRPVLRWMNIVASPVSSVRVTSPRQRV